MAVYAARFGMEEKMYQKLKEYRVEGQRVYFQYEGSAAGKEPCVEVISDHIFNVFIDYTGMGHRSRAIEGELEKQLNQGESPENGKLESVSWEESGVIIRTKYLTAIVGDNFAVDFYDREGTPLSLSYRGSRKRSGGPHHRARSASFTFARSCSAAWQRKGMMHREGQLTTTIYRKSGVLTERTAFTVWVIKRVS